MISLVVLARFTLHGHFYVFLLLLLLLLYKCSYRNANILPYIGFEIILLLHCIMLHLQNLMCCFFKWIRFLPGTSNQ